jgi:hypothetical protein
VNDGQWRCRRVRSQRRQDFEIFFGLMERASFCIGLSNGTKDLEGEESDRGAGEVVDRSEMPSAFIAIVVSSRELARKLSILFAEMNIRTAFLFTTAHSYLSGREDRIPLRKG